MWLLPLFSPIARAAAFVYYRVRYSGDRIPVWGPVLLVANHPNSLLDPMLVVAAARRPVRFLAKAPLFTDRKIGWLVKAAGAIPVYRPADDPTQVSRNLDSFREVYGVLAGGDAVGIFPEGVSHSAPSLVPLKTGAARIALGAAELTGIPFPIVPVGLVFRRKDEFRSEALVWRGAAVEWSDLAARGLGDSAAVRELTERITEGLRSVTVNLEQWEDRPLVETAVRMWEAERRALALPWERVARFDATGRLLSELRRRGDTAALALGRDIVAFGRRLNRLGLRPADLVADLRLARGLWWAVRRLHLLLPLGGVVAVVGAALWWVPYRVTGMIVSRLGLEEDVRSTWKLLVGIVVYFVWLILLAAVAGGAWGGLAALLAFILLPATGLAGLLMRERWRNAWSDAQRFFLLRSRRALMQALRERQRDLVAQMQALVEREGPVMRPRTPGTAQSSVGAP